MTPGQILAKITKLREQKDVHSKKVSELGAEIDKLSNELIEQMDELGTDQLRNANFTASITEQELPQAEDWERIYKWIKRNPVEGFALLQRRLNTAPWRDLLHARGNRPIPGIGIYKKRALSVKKTRS
jgi:hypothetical protein